MQTLLTSLIKTDAKEDDDEDCENEVQTASKECLCSLSDAIKSPTIQIYISFISSNSTF